MSRRVSSATNPAKPLQQADLGESGSDVETAGAAECAALGALDEWLRASPIRMSDDERAQVLAMLGHAEGRPRCGAVPELTVRSD